MTSTIDEDRFRTVMGRYPTGVTAIAATSPGGKPIGMVVGTFSSVSIDPPLVAFMPTRTSSSYARLREAGTYCANVLSAEQEWICRAFAVKGAEEKFKDFDYETTPSGNPKITGSVAWVEFTIENIIEAGDHDIVLGRVTDMGEGEGAVPMLFLGGGYGGFSPHSRVIPAAPDIMQQLRLADVAREDLQGVADQLRLECAAVAPVEDVIVRVASAGSAAVSARPARVGLRLPFEAPMGALLVAWAERSVQERWIRRAKRDASAAEIDAYVDGLAVVREREWAITLQTSSFERLDASIAEHASQNQRVFTSIDMHTQLDGPNAFAPAVELVGDRRYCVRNLSVPVFIRGEAAMYLSVFGFGDETTSTRISDVLAVLGAAATRVSEKIRRITGEDTDGR